MIRMVEGLPDNVVAFAAEGRVTRRDYDEILIPEVAKALGRHRRIRLYYRIGPEVSGIDPGAAWADFRVGVEHLSRWERIAVVTDVDWIRHTVHAFGFLMPAQVRVFPVAAAAEAREWIVASSEE